MDFMNYLTQSGLLIATGLFVIGIFLKQTSFIPNWLIPIILLILGVLAAVFSMDNGFTVTNILQGVFATGAAVLVNQIGKQVTTQDAGAKYDASHPAADVQPAEDLGQVQAPVGTEAPVPAGTSIAPDDTAKGDGQQ